jgi:hypothetical protein
MSVVSRRDLIQAFVSLAVALVVLGAALFVSGGTLHWPRGLLFLAVFLLLTLVAVTWFWRVNPEIFVARRRLTGQGTKVWDLVLVPIASCPYPHRRSSWSTSSRWTLTMPMCCSKPGRSTQSG